MLSFVNISLLGGGMLMAIPVILHLLMRQKPKPLLFPALRFIQQRKESNTRQLQLRHYLLLALRCGVIALAAAALARPSVASAALGSWIALLLLGSAFVVALGLTLAAAWGKRSLLVVAMLGTAALVLGGASLWVGGRALSGKTSVLGDQEAPVAAAIIIDTSPRMEYRHENKSRLAVAQEIARWLISQLPAESEIAILDGRPGAGAFAIDRAAAVNTIARLKPAASVRPLPEVLLSALQLCRQNPKLRKEVYLLTDLTQPAWRTARPAELAEAVAADPQVQLYVIDVGVDKVVNASLGRLELSSELLPEQGRLSLSVDLVALGERGPRTVELLIEEPDPRLPVVRDGELVTPKLVLRGKQSAVLGTGEGQQVRFDVVGLAPGVHQGVVRLVGEDGLAIDDVRYFAVEVQPAQRVLVVAGPGVSAELLVQAIRGNQQIEFAPRVIEQAELPATDLSQFRVICLLDPGPLAADDCTALYEAAERGAGVALFLGHNAGNPPAAFLEPAALRLLGGTLARQTRSGGDLFLAPASYDHPITAAFRQLDTSVPWDRFPIFYHWDLESLTGGARTIIPYGDGKPALVEHRPGRGRVLVFTTTPTDPLRPRDRRQPWNELLTGEDAWPGFVLINESILHLAGKSETRLNYLAGQAATLPNAGEQFPERYQLFTPRDEPQEQTARDGVLTVRFTDNPGAYRLRGLRDGPVVRGFAVNLPAEVGDLSRLSAAELDARLGEKNYQFARNREEIDRAVGADRVGSEFFPLLGVLLAGALAAEYLLANRFYRPGE